MGLGTSPDSQQVGLCAVSFADGVGGNSAVNRGRFATTAFERLRIDLSALAIEALGGERSGSRFVQR